MKDHKSAFLSGTILMLASLNATADFGGGWKHYGSGTVHNSNAPEVVRSTQTAKSSKSSGFGGEWRHDSSGTISYSDGSEKRGVVASSPSKTYTGSRFSKNWVHDGTGTLTYRATPSNQM